MSDSYSCLVKFEIGGGMVVALMALAVLVILLAPALVVLVSFQF